jgi:hypothetical protein
LEELPLLGTHTLVAQALSKLQVGARFAGWSWVTRVHQRASKIEQDGSNETGHKINWILSLKTPRKM